MRLVWSQTFVRAYKRQTRRNPKLRERILHTLQLLEQDPFHPALRSHKLKGELAGVWACVIDYDNRLLFEFVENPETGEKELFLITLGTHDAVY